MEPTLLWGAFTWHQVYLTLAVVFIGHLAAFMLVAHRTGEGRYLLLVGTFSFLALVYGARTLHLGSPQYFLTCRILAAVCTVAYLSLLARSRFGPQALGRVVDIDHSRSPQS